MPSKSNTINSPREVAPWVLSLGAHGAFAVLALVLVFAHWGVKAPVEFEVIERPVEAPKALTLSPPKVEPQPIVKPRQRKVFGVSKKALADTASAGEAVKLGNTLATAPYDKKLRADDADSLPIPTDEYLVTAMPSLLTEVRVEYPAEEKKKGIAGPVVMELLIDDTGNVRDVNLLSGPDLNLNAAAVRAARGFKFKPARVGAKNVAVKIRYTYRFVIER